MGEFELIRRFFAAAACAAPAADVALGIGDDCALLAPPAGEQLAVSTDTLVEGVHFPAGCDPFLLAQRALAVSASDLAAMGAAPLAFTLALTLPQADAEWLQGFARGLDAMARQCGLALVGGDTTRGPLSMTLTVFGRVPAGQALTRAGARPGDLLCVGARSARLERRWNWCWSEDRRPPRWPNRCWRATGRRPRNSVWASPCAARPAPPGHLRRAARRLRAYRPRFRRCPVGRMPALAGKRRVERPARRRGSLAPATGRRRRLRAGFHPAA